MNNRLLEILALRKEGKMLKDIAKKYNISRQRVYQILKKEGLSSFRKRNNYDLICKNCKKKFQSNIKSKKYCNLSCYNNYRKKNLGFDFELSDEEIKKISQRRIEHRLEKIKEYQKRYYTKNVIKIRIKQREYYLKHRDKILEYAKKHKSIKVNQNLK